MSALFADELPKATAQIANDPPETGQDAARQEKARRDALAESLAGLRPRD